MPEPLPKLPPEFQTDEPEAPEWWTDLYGPTEQGDPIERPWEVDSRNRFN